MKSKKILLLCMVITILSSCVILLLFIVNHSAAPTGSPDTIPDPYAGKYIVGICQYDDLISLNAATEGFKQALKDKLKDKVVFNEKNASGDPDKCSQIMDQLLSGRIDLILANSTSSLQTAADATKDIPILGTSVTDYVAALGIKDFGTVTGRNISGTSDLAPLDLQADIISEILPEAKTISIIYCSKEVNSVYQVERIKPIFEDKGFSVKLFPFNDNNDIEQTFRSACQSESDAIFVPTDNHIAASAEMLGDLAKENKIPIFTGDDGTMSECGVASLSINYYELGYKTGEMACSILAGEKTVDELTIEYPKRTTKKYNPDMCEELGITIPEGYSAYKGTK